MLWKTIAVVDPDPAQFAQKLQLALNEISEAEYTIMNMMDRGDALVITAHKVQEPMPHHLVPQATAKARQPVRASAPSETRDEVVYHFKKDQELHRLTFASREEAAACITSHLVENDDVLPIQVSVVSVTSYEPKDFPVILMKWAHGE